MTRRGVWGLGLGALGVAFATGGDVRNSSDWHEWKRSAIGALRVGTNTARGLQLVSSPRKTRVYNLEVLGEHSYQTLSMRVAAHNTSRFQDGDVARIIFSRLVRGQVFSPEQVTDALFWDGKISPVEVRRRVRVAKLALSHFQEPWHDALYRADEIPDLEEFISRALRNDGVLPLVPLTDPPPNEQVDPQNVKSDEDLRAIVLRPNEDDGIASSIARQLIEARAFSPEQVTLDTFRGGHINPTELKQRFRVATAALKRLQEPWHDALLRGDVPPDFKGTILEELRRDKIRPRSMAHHARQYLLSMHGKSVKEKRDYVVQVTGCINALLEEAGLPHVTATEKEVVFDENYKMRLFVGAGRNATTIVIWPNGEVRQTNLERVYPNNMVDLKSLSAERTTERKKEYERLRAPLPEGTLDAMMNRPQVLRESDTITNATAWLIESGYPLRTARWIANTVDFLERSDSSTDDKMKSLVTVLYRINEILENENSLDPDVKANRGSSWAAHAQPLNTTFVIGDLRVTFYYDENASVKIDRYNPSEIHRVQ